MKKFFVMAMAMVMAVAANAESVSKKAKAPKSVTYTATINSYDNDGYANTVSVDAFEVANIEIPARVRVIEGNNYGVNVITLDKTAENAIRYNVKNGVLRVFTSNEGIENGQVVINLVVPTAPKITTSANLDKYSVR